MHYLACLTFLVIAAESRRVPLLMSCLHGTQVGEVGMVRVV